MKETNTTPHPMMLMRGRDRNFLPNPFTRKPRKGNTGINHANSKIFFISVLQPVQEIDIN